MVIARGGGSQTHVNFCANVLSIAFAPWRFQKPIQKRHKRTNEISPWLTEVSLKGAILCSAEGPRWPLAFL